MRRTTTTIALAAAFGLVAAATVGMASARTRMSPAGLFFFFDSEVKSVSCTSPGNCGAGGYFQDRKGHLQAFVISQVRGVWGRPHALTGPAHLNTGGSAAVTSVSCSSPGNCGAGGFYQTGLNAWQVFVVSQIHGRWGTAIQVPGTSALNTWLQAGIGSVSCTSPGNCSAGGYVRPTSAIQAPFVVTEVNGRWNTAIEVPGAAALEAGGGAAAVNSVSCSSPGNCGAGGWYKDTPDQLQAFVVSQVAGIWGTATEVPGTAALNTGGYAAVSAMSCPSDGSCGGVGWYSDAATNAQRAFVVDENSGTWGTAVEVPGITRFNQLGVSALQAVSCRSAGNCAAGGWEAATQGLLVSESGGRWGNARLVPGLGRLNAARDAKVTSVSCGSRGHCTAVGFYSDARGRVQGFQVSEVRGRWRTVGQIPGLTSLNTAGYAFVDSVSCAAPGDCVVGGAYTAGRRHAVHAFVATERDGHWGKARPVF